MPSSIYDAKPFPPDAPVTVLLEAGACLVCSVLHMHMKIVHSTIQGTSPAISC